MEEFFQHVNHIFKLDDHMIVVPVSLFVLSIIQPIDKRGGGKLSFFIFVYSIFAEKSSKYFLPFLNVLAQVSCSDVRSSPQSKSLETKALIIIPWPSFFGLIVHEPLGKFHCLAVIQNCLKIGLSWPIMMIGFLLASFLLTGDLQRGSVCIFHRMWDGHAHEIHIRQDLLFQT